MKPSPPPSHSSQDPVAAHNATASLLIVAGLTALGVVLVALLVFYSGTLDIGGVRETAVKIAEAKTKAEVETFVSLYEGIDHHVGSGGENVSN